MKLRIKIFQWTVLASLLSLFVLSCQKENSITGSEDEQQMLATRVSSEADSESEIVFNGVFDDAIGVNDEVGVAGTGIFGRTTACPSVEVIRLNPNAPFPVKIIFDFTAAGCVGRDGHLRRGKIITTYTGRLLYPGSMATTVFDGFYIDSVKVEGTHKILNSSPATPTQPLTRQFTVDVTNARLLRPNGNFTEWTSHKVITQIEGIGTNIPMDDIFKVEGNASGRVQRGNLIVRWESNIIEPLVKRFNCRWIVKGRVRTVRVNTASNGPWVGVLDFGTGNCDNQAVVTINGVSHQITLP